MYVPCAYYMCPYIMHVYSCTHVLVQALKCTMCSGPLRESTPENLYDDVVHTCIDCEKVCPIDHDAVAEQVALIGDKWRDAVALLDSKKNIAGSARPRTIVCIVFNTV